MTTLDEGRAALARGRPVVLVTPPAPERAGDAWSLTEGTTLVVCADAASATEWAAVAPAGRRMHVVTGLARAARILKEHPPEIVAGAACDLATLLTRSALPCEAVATIVLAWPEALVAADAGGDLDTLLAAAPEARRIVLSWNPPLLRDFLERHARRAEIVGALPLAPAVPARYALVTASRRPVALRHALDHLDPKRPLVWRGEAVDAGAVAGADLILCLCLPTRDELASLAQLAPVLVFVTTSQLAYLRAIAAPLTAQPLVGPAAERAHDRAEALRARIAAELDAGPHDAQLVLLEPLLERYDAAEVAAALLALRETGSGKGETAPSPTVPSGWVRVFVNVGKKDRASAKDLVGALIREVGLAKTDLGRIEVRDTFSVVDVAATVAERVVKDLSGVMIRGRRAIARLDRYG